MVATLAAFLRTSTIHGLAHLAPESNDDTAQANLGLDSVQYLIIRIVRWIFWPPCICGALFLSYLFISANMEAWNTQPSSISMVSPVTLKSTGIVQPMVTVCPHYVDFASLAVNFFNSDLYSRDKVLEAEINTAVREAYITCHCKENSIFTNEYPYLFLSNTLRLIDFYFPVEEDRFVLPEKIFENCTLGDADTYFYTNSTIASEECEFVSVLAIANCYVNISRFNYYKTWQPHQVTKDYVQEILSNNTSPTTVGFIEYLQQNLDKDVLVMSCGKTNQSAMEILSKMYSYFFRVFRPDSVKMERLRGLSDFDTINFHPAPFDFSKVKEHGTFFEFLNGLVQQANFRGLEPILTSKIMNILAEHLGSITPRPLVQEVMARLNEFSYSYLDKPFFKLRDLYMKRLCNTNPTGDTKLAKDDHDHGPPLPCNPGQDISASCSEYCNRTTNLSPEHEEFLVKFFDMTTGIVSGKLMLDTPRNMGYFLSVEPVSPHFPLCSSPKIQKVGHIGPLLKNVTEDCWQRVVTDSGVCFSNTRITGQRIRDNGPDSGISFLFELGSPFGVVVPVTGTMSGTQRLTVRVTPPGHFAIGKIYNAEEVSRSVLQSSNMRYPVDIIYTVGQIVKTTPDFRGMGIERRKCLFSDEKELEHFPVYSEANCALECAWKRARNRDFLNIFYIYLFCEIMMMFLMNLANGVVLSYPLTYSTNCRCGCVPWFLKRLFPSVAMCEITGNDCFRGVVDKRYHKDENSKDACSLSCLPDCEAFEMTAEHRQWGTAAERIATGQECYGEALGQPEWLKGLGCTLHRQRDSREVVGTIHPEYRDKTVLDWLGLSARLSDLQRKPNLFRVYSKRRSAMQVVITASMSWIDLVSNIGGSLGLCAGISMLSLAEIIFWAIKYIGTKVVERKATHK